MKVSKATVVGRSVSGMDSLIASILRPGVFDKAAPIGSSPQYLNDSATGYAGGFEQTDPEGIFSAMAANCHAWASGFAPVAVSNPERPQLAEYYAGTLTAIRPDIAQAVLRVIFTSDHRAELSKVKTLVYVMQSQADVAVPSAVGHYPAAHIANSRLVTLQSQGHLPHLSDPNAVNRAIEELLAA
jgi:sigma-B regulation protein RsbQ